MSFNRNARYIAGQRPRVMGHRGSSGICPENTMISFEQAVKDGADILEMDVQISKDGQVVVIHDPSVDRTSNGKGLTKTMSYAQLKEFDAGYRFTTDGGKTFPFRAKGVSLPLFEDVLKAFPQMPINVEIKDSSPLLIARMNELLRAYGRIADGSVLVAADSHEIMKAFRRLAPDAITGTSSAEVYRFVIGAWLRLPDFLIKPVGFAFQIPALKKGLNIPTASVIRRAHEFGAEVHVWTVNKTEEMHELLDRGVDGIFTDYPALMRKLIDSRK